MINIINKQDCVGCNACVQICPKQSINMREDGQGFLYPKVNLDTCIKCGLCEKVCPVINQAVPRKPGQVYAAKNKSREVVENSSSGGIFHALAKYVIDQGGVVFGARFNEKWEVVHGYSDTSAGIKAFQKSKYVQSRIGDSYLNTERFLKEGKLVLFSGTPCQISGLRLFLRKPYTNLLTVDVVCHGVPSPLVWREYLKYVTKTKIICKNYEFQSPLSDIRQIISSIDFRDKKIGWENFGFSVHTVARQNEISDLQSTIGYLEDEELLFEPLTENLYLQIFLKDLDLRPSCYKCPAKAGKSGSDLTIADFWGIRKSYPELYDSKGVSLILANTPKGTEILLRLQDITLSEVDYLSALNANPSIERSVSKPKYYLRFWNSFESDKLMSVQQILLKMKPSITRRIKGKLKGIIKKILK